MYTNVDCLPNKCNELLTIIQERKPHVICHTEVFPKQHLNQTDILSFEIDGYTKFCQSEERCHKGILIYVHNSIDATPIKELNEDLYVESFWLSLKLENKHLNIGTIYRSPNASPENNDMLNNLIDKASRLFYDQRLIIVGDFNFPSINWSNFTSNHNLNHSSSRFINTILQNDLHQHVDQFTRSRGTDTPTCLDLIITNDSNIVSHICYDPPIGNSDHCVLCFNVDYECSTTTTEHKILDFKKANFQAWRSRLSETDWKKELADKTADESWLFFKGRVNEAVNQFVPVKSLKKSTFKNRPQWMSKAAILALRRKKRCWKKYCSQQTQYAAYKYRSARNKCNKVILQCKKSFERKIVDEVKENPKAFWSYLNSKRNSEKGIPKLKKPDNSFTQTDYDTANTLNSFFTSVFTKDDDVTINNVPTLNNEYSYTPMSDIFCTEEEVLQKLNSLKPNKSCGPDKMHPMVLLQTKDVCVTPLTIIFNKSLSEGVIPTDWKMAQITALHKKGDRSNPNNYRPISLTSVACKVLESIIRDHIEKHMAQHKLFSQHQYGFRSGRSCNSQLLDAMNDWTFAVNNNQDVDIILLDFAKAFDSVSHCRLLSKLKSYGIIGNTLTWIKAFLTDRKQFVQVKNSSSNLSDVLSGVPQGSVLGPTLFLIFINDLPENVKCKVKIFADDTKIYTSVKSDEDISKLQEDLNSLHVWSTTWGLKFNASKCTHVHVGNKFQTNTYYMKDDDGSNTNIKHSTAERDLGVIINDHLSPENHVNEIVAKAYRIIGCIKHSFTFMNKELFIILYKSLSHMCYILGYIHT